MAIVYVIENEDAFYARNDGKTPLFSTKMAGAAALFMLGESAKGFELGGPYDAVDLMQAMNADGIPFCMADAHDPLGVDELPTNPLPEPPKATD